MNVSQVLAAAMLAGGNALFNSAVLTFYSGTQPVSPETALSGNTALVAFTFAATAFAAPSFATPNEQAVASFVSASSNPLVSGTVSFARVVKSDGTTVLADYTVGTTTQDIVIGNTGIQTGVPVTITSFTNKLPAI